MMKKIALFVAFTYAITHFVPVPAYSKSIYPEDITELTEAECQSVVGGVSSRDLCHAGIVLVLTGLAISTIGIASGVGFSIVYPDKSVGVTFIGAPMIIGSTIIGGTLVEFGIILIALSPFIGEDSCFTLTLPHNDSLANEVLLYPDSASLLTETQHLESSFF